MRRTLLALALTAALPGCGATAWVGAHAKELAAIGIVASTVQAVSGAIAQAAAAARQVDQAVEEVREEK